MRKHILILVMATLISSCSRSDGNGNHPITQNNLSGKWYFNKVIHADGTVESFENICATERANVELFNYGRINYSLYSIDCVENMTTICTHYQIENGNMITSCNEPFSNAVVTVFTDNDLVLEYEIPRNQSGSTGYTNVKSITFTRQ